MGLYVDHYLNGEIILNGFVRNVVSVAVKHVADHVQKSFLGIIGITFLYVQE